VPNKKWLWLAAGAAAAALVASPRIATAYKVWEATQRQEQILAAKQAIASGADGLPQLSGLLQEQDSDNPGNEADDAEIRRLVMAAEVGPRTPESQK
jgi:hypothetical protein